MRGEFDTDIADTDFFGDVRAGDPLPYIPEQQFNATLGVDEGMLVHERNMHLAHLNDDGKNSVTQRNRL